MTLRESISTAIQNLVGKLNFLWDYVKRDNRLIDGGTTDFNLVKNGCYVVDAQNGDYDLVSKLEDGETTKIYVFNSPLTPDSVVRVTADPGIEFKTTVFLPTDPVLEIDETHRTIILHRQGNFIWVEAEGRAEGLNVTEDVLVRFSRFIPTDQSVPAGTSSLTISGGTTSINTDVGITTTGTNLIFNKPGVYYVNMNLSMSNNSSFNSQVSAYMQQFTAADANLGTISQITFTTVEIDGIGARTGGGATLSAIINVTGAGEYVRFFTLNQQPTVIRDKNINVIQLTEKQYK